MPGKLQADDMIGRYLCWSLHGSQHGRFNGNGRICPYQCQPSSGSFQIPFAIKHSWRTRMLSFYKTKTINMAFKLSINRWKNNSCDHYFYFIIGNFGGPGPGSWDSLIEAMLENLSWRRTILRRKVNSLSPTALLPTEILTKILRLTCQLEDGHESISCSVCAIMTRSTYWKSFNCLLPLQWHGILENNHFQCWRRYLWVHPRERFRPSANHPTRSFLLPSSLIFHDATLGTATKIQDTIFDCFRVFDFPQALRNVI